MPDTARPPHILLIAHTPLASALREAALHVLPDSAPALTAIDVPAHEPPEATLQRALHTLSAAALLPPVALLVMTDMLGATPSNVAHRLTATIPSASLLAGANLPMLLRALSYRHEAAHAPAAWADRALTGGQHGIVLAHPVADAATAT